MRISLFITCYNDTLFPQTGKAVVRVLERLGHEVEFRAAQTCCGQLHYNAGYAAEARPLMRQFLRVFAGDEVICVPSSSCVAMIRDHYPKMAAESGDAAIQSQVQALLPRVFEFSELLVDKLGVTDVGAVFPHTVTLHTPCHALRSLGVRDQPIALLRAVRGLRFVELPRYDECCGFGGTFAVKNADVSAAMLEDKIAGIRETKVEVCAATDNSCLMQIGGGLHRQNAGVRCLHLAEILAEQEQSPSLSGPSTQTRAPSERRSAGGSREREAASAATEPKVAAKQRREPAASLGGRQGRRSATESSTERKVAAKQRREPAASVGRRRGWGPAAE
jgi:L-lactate dehydrogenase complex protein LldE